jgi:RNA polymerase sigma-70 factor (ECF subfamily)
MDGDSVPLHFPLGRRAAEDAEVTAAYHALRQPLRRYLLGLGLSMDEAEDVIQDVFLTLHRHVADGRSRHNLRGWVFRVAHNCARNRQQRYERRFGAPIERAADSIAPGATPERTAIDNERFRRLGRAIRQLPDTERECLLLRAEGLRYREIGEVLNLPTSTVADIISRAIRTLAEKCDV